MNSTAQNIRTIILHGLNAPVGPDERRVPQYGPEWMAHVSLGGNVRNGNILCLPLVPVR
jgi:hypothetical protein